MRIKLKKAAGSSTHPEDNDANLETLTPSSGIIVSAIVGEDDLLKINIKGRPSGKMSDGRHGDHTTSQILSVHGIRRFGNGTKVSEIDEIRSVRETVFNFITAVAVLNHPKGQILEPASSTSEEVDSTSAKLTTPLNALYEGMNLVLDKYNARRYKETELTLLEKAASNIPDPLDLSPKEADLLRKSGGISAILNANIVQNRQSNRVLICETFEDLARLTSTYYYNIPNTAYPVITGYAASGSEGGNVRATLQRLDTICDKIAEQRQPSAGAARAKRSSAIKTLADIVREIAQLELSDKSGELDKLARKAAPSAKDTARMTILQYQIPKLEASTASGNDSLQYIALKLKDLFHYPEILDPTLAAANGRNNDSEEFYDKTAKHLFLVFNTYPELSAGAEDKARITGLFLHEVIHHQTNSGVTQGWPSLIGINPVIHTEQVLAKLDELENLKQENLYIVTEGYRSRASSGAMEEMKQQILEPVIEFIGANFDLEEERFDGLVQQLKELDLTGKSDAEFRGEMMKEIRKYCVDDNVKEKQLGKLEELLIPSKTKVAEGRK